MKHFISIISVIAFVSVYATDCGHDHSHDKHNHGSHDHKHAVEHDDHDHAHKHDDHDHAHKHDDHDHVHKHDDHDHASHANSKKSLEVSQVVQRAMGLKTVKPFKCKLASTISLAGRYELTPDARTTLATPVAGKLKIVVKPLTKVRKGDVIFTVESSDLSARAREISVLEKRLDVYKKIGTSNAQLESELAVKKAEREAIIGDAQEMNGVITVCAGADGVVEGFLSDSGVWVEPGAGIVKLVKPDSLRLKALAAASDVAKLADGLKAFVDGAEGEAHFGIGDDSGIVPVYVIFPAGKVKARAGERATAECVTDETVEDVITVPTRSIIKIGLTPTVFVRDEHDSDKFTAVPVVPGISSGSRTQVAGLPDDDDIEIVSEGAYELKLALPSANASPAGHFHADGKFHVGED